MKLSPILLLVVAALLLSGCATTTFSTYTGAQQDWPTSDHAYTRDVRGITVYRGLPPRPYTVLGYFTIYTLSAHLDNQLAYFARLHGADAVILEQRSEGPGGSIGFANIYGQGGIYGGTAVRANYAATSLEARFIRFADAPHAAPAPPAPAYSQRVH